MEKERSSRLYRTNMMSAWRAERPCAVSPWASCANAARPSSGITYRWSDLRDPTASSASKNAAMSCAGRPSQCRSGDHRHVDAHSGLFSAADRPADLSDLLCEHPADPLRDEDGSDRCGFLDPPFDQRIPRQRLYGGRKREGYDESALTVLLKDKVSVLTGQSGAGKSSLLNRIEPSFHLHTQQTSKALGRGRHTTRHCELHPVARRLGGRHSRVFFAGFQLYVHRCARCVHPGFSALSGRVPLQGLRASERTGLCDQTGRCAGEDPRGALSTLCGGSRADRTGTGPLLRKGDEL